MNQYPKVYFGRTPTLSIYPEKVSITRDTEQENFDHTQSYIKLTTDIFIW